MRLEMSNYIVTGATSGIGETFVKSIASEDNRLIIVGRNAEKLDYFKNNLSGNIYTVKYDLRDLENIKTLFEPCVNENFKLDGLIYCAGIDEAWPIKVNNLTKMQEIMTVNCFAFVEMCRFFYSKRYSVDGAAIVAISSLASVLNEKGNSAYSMSKAALNSAIKTMSKEFGRRKIRVNAILPGGVDTPMGTAKGDLIALAKDNSVETIKDSDNPQPLGGISAEAIVRMIEFLLGTEAQFCTGELMTISGGRVFNI